MLSLYVYCKKEEESLKNNDVSKVRGIVTFNDCMKKMSGYSAINPLKNNDKRCFQS